MEINVFDQIKSKVKLLEYASKFIRLKLVGSRYLGLCPFHREKTPSFYIDDKSDLFYCFGCNNGGDLFSFYCLLNKCDKKIALSELSKIAGIQYKTVIVKNDLDKLLAFFVSKKEHIEFLVNRGVSEESIKKFKLGWSSTFFDMIKFIRNNKLSLGNLGFNESFLKSFQNRVVFPIFNKIGNLVSFSGRNLEGGSYKYINGADSEIFHKSEVLYGLNFVKNREEIYLVEGHIDVVIMQQFGFSCVASMGTAVSKEHLNLLWKYTNKIIVMMDGDEAGIKSAFKVALLSLELINTGKEIYFVNLPTEHDPASYLQNQYLIENLKRYPLYEFLLKNKGEVPKNLDKRALFFKELNDYADLISDYSLKNEYKKYWNSFRWYKKNVHNPEKLLTFGKEYVILLLFKYVMCYNELLDHVAEDFLKLDMNKYYKDNLLNLINNTEINKELFIQVSQIRIDDSLEFSNEIIDEWYNVYHYIQESLNEDLKNKLLEDFSEESWEKYKKLMEKKDQNYNE